MRWAAVESSSGIGRPSAVLDMREVEEALGWKGGGKTNGNEWRRDRDDRVRGGGSVWADGAPAIAAAEGSLLPSDDEVNGWDD